MIHTQPSISCSNQRNMRKYVLTSLSCFIRSSESLIRAIWLWHQWPNKESNQSHFPTLEAMEKYEPHTEEFNLVLLDALTHLWKLEQRATNFFTRNLPNMVPRGLQVHGSTSSDRSAVNTPLQEKFVFPSLVTMVHTIRHRALVLYHFSCSSKFEKLHKGHGWQDHCTTSNLRNDGTTLPWTICLLFTPMVLVVRFSWHTLISRMSSIALWIYRVSRAISPTPLPVFFQRYWLAFFYPPFVFPILLSKTSCCAILV